MPANSGKRLILQTVGWTRANLSQVYGRTVICSRAYLILPISAAVVLGLTRCDSGGSYLLRV